MATTNIMLAGVGGQGIILAGRIIAACAFNTGLDVKASEVHGMAQRGGSVVSHIRFGEQVHSPLVRRGTADFLLAMEELEGLRNLTFLKPGGLLVLNRRTIKPAGGDPTPYPQDIPARARAAGLETAAVNAQEISRELGNPQVENIVLIGALSRRLSFSRAAWEQAIAGMVSPGLAALNLAAFARGAEPGS